MFLFTTFLKKKKEIVNKPPVYTIEQLPSNFMLSNRKIPKKLKTNFNNNNRILEQIAFKKSINANTMLH